MKKHYFLLSAALLVTAAGHAQGTELFFSEYDEGAHQSGVNYGGATNSTGSERALEVYNPTTSVVNLNPYSVRRYANGSVSPTEEERLFRSNASQTAVGTNTLNPRAAFVLASGEATLPVIRNAANQFSVGHAPISGPTVITGGGTVYFNGDDAVALVRYPSGTAGTGAGVIIDLLGVVGEQPTYGGTGTGTGNWEGTNASDPPVIINGASVQPYVRSANQSLVRRPSISRGSVNTVRQYLPGTTTPNPGGYNIANDWAAYSYATPPGGVANPGGQLYDQLGSHNDYTGPYGTYQTTLGTLAKFDANISVYPNPARGSATVEIKDALVGRVVVLNSLGQSISAEAKGQGQEKLTLNISALKPGLYFVQILSADGQTKIYKELVVQ